MEDGLTCAGAVIQYRAVAREETTFECKARGNQLQLAKNGLIFWRGFRQRFKMLSGANQYMRGRLRANVFESEDIGILVDDLRRNLLRGDFAE